MTSLQLFPYPDDNVLEPTEWGTGTVKEAGKSSIHKTPNWHYRGVPTEQYYTLTPLKLSNIRSNDQLLPKPQESDLGRDLITKPFPAEHPYSSHTSRLAVFPKFDSTEDPKRGVAARRERPINAEMPANPYNVTVVTKTKGFGTRREIMDIPRDTDREPLYWEGDQNFDQVVKIHGDRQQYYPYATKTFVPNLQKRTPEMTITDRSANILRNLERAQWKTTHELNYTGMGPSNTLNLDNYDEKMKTKAVTGLDDDTLYPLSTNTFDPPRPVEGRIARALTPKPRPQTPSAFNNDDTAYTQKPNLSDEEEDMLLNGREYVNLPEELEDGESPSWRVQGPDGFMDTLAFARNKTQADPISYMPAEAPAYDDSYPESLGTQHRDNVKQMEAENRWRLLESHTPRHDVQALQNKYVHVKDKELPPTFYNHEGRYNEERVGLYKTSYEPEKLSYSISRQQTGDPSTMKNSLRRSTPNLSTDISVGNDGNNAFVGCRAEQRDRMQPTAESASTRVQEAGTISTESEYEQEYNVPKFLQEFKLAKHARTEPLQVLSDQNKSLSNVRVSAGRRSGKSVQFSNDVLVATGTEAGPMLYSSVPVNGLTDDEKFQIAKSSKATVNTTQYVSSHAQWRKNQELRSEKAIPRMKSFDTIDRGKEVFPASHLEIAKSARTGRRPITSDGLTQRNDFNSKSSNFAPTDLRNSMTYQTAYQTQFPIYHSDTMDDLRFSWEPGCGTPRPGSQLLKIENRFCKSAVRKLFHDTFVEGAPDLRSHIFKGKKHIFYGQNAQTLRG